MLLLKTALNAIFNPINSSLEETSTESTEKAIEKSSEELAAEVAIAVGMVDNGRGTVANWTESGEKLDKPAIPFPLAHSSAVKVSLIQ